LKVFNRLFKRKMFPDPQNMNKKNQVRKTPDFNQTPRDQFCMNCDKFMN
jgi:hypothetical protein